MRRSTITLPDELEGALEAYRQSREVELPLTAVVQAALREYLQRRGFVARPGTAAFYITSAGEGSGRSDVSLHHDRYFAERDDEQ